MPKPKALKRSEALERQRKYDEFVSGVVLNSSPDAAQSYFETLSESQQRRILSSDIFADIMWIKALRNGAATYAR